jgi:hypothetical protein
LHRIHRIRPLQIQHEFLINFIEHGSLAGNCSLLRGLRGLLGQAGCQPASLQAATQLGGRRKQAPSAAAACTTSLQGSPRPATARKATSDDLWPSSCEVWPRRPQAQGQPLSCLAASPGPPARGLRTGADQRSGSLAGGPVISAGAAADAHQAGFQPGTYIAPGHVLKASHAADVDG